MPRKLPKTVADTLLHVKDTDLTEKIMMPITRYRNVLNAPNVIKNPTDVAGAPFVLLEQSSEIVSVDKIRKMCGAII
jgi:hypothetical protein|nr:MAG TPA: hypothetical protein [Caudoviricetes sp.]